jgi:hypothetical protein
MRHAEGTAEFRFGVPARKEFRIRQRRGSKPVQLMVIEPLMAAETDRPRAKLRGASPQGATPPVESPGLLL